MHYSHFYIKTQSPESGPRPRTTSHSHCAHSGETSPSRLEHGIETKTKRAPVPVLIDSEINALLPLPLLHLPPAAVFSRS